MVGLTFDIAMGLWVCQEVPRTARVPICTDSHLPSVVFALSERFLELTRFDHLDPRSVDPSCSRLDCVH